MIRGLSHSRDRGIHQPPRCSLPSLYLHHTIDYGSFNLGDYKPQFLNGACSGPKAHYEKTSMQSSSPLIRHIVSRYFTESPVYTSFHFYHAWFGCKVFLVPFKSA